MCVCLRLTSVCVRVCLCVCVCVCVCVTQRMSESGQLTVVWYAELALHSTDEQADKTTLTNMEKVR